MMLEVQKKNSARRDGSNDQLEDSDKTVPTYAQKDLMENNAEKICEKKRWQKQAKIN